VRGGCVNWEYKMKVNSVVHATEYHVAPLDKRMKKRWHLPAGLMAMTLAVLLGSGVEGYGQIYRLNAYSFLSHAEWKDSLYRFARFQEGSIIFGRGTTTPLKRPMNYNIYLKQMQILSEQGDTIPMEYSSAVNVVILADHLFLNDFSNGFVEILTEGDVSLGVRHSIKVMMETTRGERFIGLDMGPGMTSKFDRFFIKEATYCWIDKESKVRPANKHWILKLFPNKRERIESYLTKNSINFKVDEDLISLLNFCNEETSSP
jgi:hypothetical protein